MIQITCVKKLFSNIFQQKNDKSLSSKRRLSELDDLQKHDETQKKRKIDEIEILSDTTKENSFEVSQEESKENNEEPSKENELKKQELTQILQKRKGVLLVPFESGGQQYYKLSCQIHHKFTLSLQELLGGQWCKRCEALMEEARLYAKSKQGELLNGFYEEFLSFLCVNQHIWKIHNKSWKNRWCSKCICMNKEEEKKRHFEENMKKEEVLKSQQSKLFEEAKRKYCEYEPKVSSYYSFYKEESKTAIVQCYRMIEEEAKNIAKIQANLMIEKKLIEDPSQNNALMEQFISCYKIILIPIDILKKYMECLSKEELKREYREFVKIIHPDKNNFAQARTAFLKYHDAYESISKLNNI